MTPAQTPRSNGETHAVRMLRAVKLLHTIVWVVFAGSTLAIIGCAVLGAPGLATVFAAVVGIEVLVLTVNDLQCPLTAPIVRYRAMARQAGLRTDDADLYLVPGWLARHNKLVFGSLYVIGLALTAIAWLRA